MDKLVVIVRLLISKLKKIIIKKILTRNSKFDHLLRSTYLHIMQINRCV